MAGDCLSGETVSKDKKSIKDLSGEICAVRETMLTIAVYHMKAKALFRSCSGYECMSDM